VLLLQFTLHAIKYFLESFSWHSGTPLWISRNGGIDSSDLRVFSDCVEKCEDVNSLFGGGSPPRNAVENIFDQLKLLLRDVNLVSLPELGQLL